MAKGPDRTGPVGRAVSTDRRDSSEDVWASEAAGHGAAGLTCRGVIEWMGLTDVSCCWFLCLLAASAFSRDSVNVIGSL